MFTFKDKNGIEVNSGDVIKFQYKDDPDAIGVFYRYYEVKLIVTDNSYINPWLVEFQHETAEKLIPETKEFEILVRAVIHQKVCNGNNRWYLQDICKNYIKD